MQTKLKISIPSADPINVYDPINVDTADKAVIIFTIFSPLFYFDSDGKIRGALAESFILNENILTVKLKDSQSTIDGNLITSKDVVQSFKRNLYLNSGTHGNLGHFLKDCKIEKTLEDSCISITIKSSLEVTFELSKPYLLQLFLYTLTNPDFVIVPFKSIDWNEKQLSIKDFRNTTGGYYVHETDKNGTHTLIKNKNVSVAPKSAPEIIELVPTGVLEKNLDFITSGKFDLVPTIDTVSPNTLIDLSKSNDSYSVYKTHAIKCFSTFFELPAKSSSTAQERISVGRIIKQVYLDHFKDTKKIEESFDYFSDFGGAPLSQDQLRRVTNLILENNVNSITRTFKGVVMYATDEMIHEISSLSNGKIKIYKTRKDFIAENGTRSKWDFRLVSIDAGFTEDFSMLSYLFESGWFGHDRNSGQIWINDYLEIPDISKRLEQVRKLHYEALIEGMVVPVGRASYYALVKKPWKVHFPKLFAGSPLWMITKE